MAAVESVQKARKIQGRRRNVRLAIDRVPKYDYVLLAMLLLGAIDRFVDAEDIAAQCYQMNPSAFRWVKYDYPDKAAVLDALRRIRKMLGPGYILSPRANTTQYRLTDKGLQRAMELAKQMLGKTFRSSRALVQALRGAFSASGKPTGQATGVDVGGREVAAALRLIVKHPTYRVWQSGRLGSLPRWRLTDVLQCLPDAPQSVIRERLLYYKGLAQWANRPEFSKFLSALAQALGQSL